MNQTSTRGSFNASWSFFKRLDGFRRGGRRLGPRALQGVAQLVQQGLTPADLQGDAIFLFDVVGKQRSVPKALRESESAWPLFEVVPEFL